MSRSLLSFSLAVVIAAAPTAAFAAKQLKIQGIEKPTLDADFALPRRGLTMAQVERDFGRPSEKVPAVGEPPIARWIYSKFIVYFETDRVIHAVVLKSK